MIRNSNVQNIFINGISSGSVFQIGESNIISKRNNTLVLEKQIQQFNGKEGNFNNYPIFRRPINIPTIVDDVNMNIVNVCNDINVGTIKLTTIAGDSVLHIGTTNRVHGVAKVHKIDQYVSPTAAFGD
ncbi:MAG: spore germination protein GerPE [Bacillaceae bacterium]